MDAHEKSISATNATVNLEVGDYLSRCELVELAVGFAVNVTAVKNRMAVTYRSAKFRAQNIHPDREFKITTSSTLHGDNHILVAATLMRES